jgi:hypothetical protein
LRTAKVVALPIRTAKQRKTTGAARPGKLSIRRPMKLTITAAAASTPPST